ncbi:MAG: acyl-CoA thioesterase-1 [Lentisphaeria bacterium]|jgi:acyl-CoA thioesterase-1
MKQSRQYVCFGFARAILLCATALVFLLQGEVYANELAQENVPVLKKILVVGDSLSAAYKLSSHEGWVKLMSERITAEQLPYEVVNASISGATTAAGLQLMPAVLATHTPQILLLELGANDGLQGKPVAYITNNLRKLIELGRDSGAQVVLIGIRIPPNFGPRYTEPFFQQYSDLAQQYQLPLVPFLLDGVAGHSELMMEDGLHPQALGQEVVLNNVWSVVESLLAP